MRILLIDDEPGTTENLVAYLEDRLHQTEVLNWVGDKEEHLYRALDDFRPDGVVLDYDMVPSGLALYGKIKAWSESVSIVFYTKYAGSPHHQVRLIKAGVDISRIIKKTDVADDIPKILKALRKS